ncbi:MAG: hypothetical protein M1829_000672 [Trizodia sp. TS-e1964]|nr:MAG: hypothetical protein M1829_000672 [Trizodia sp. TS-e1964]
MFDFKKKKKAEQLTVEPVPPPGLRKAGALMCPPRGDPAPHPSLLPPHPSLAEVPGSSAAPLRVQRKPLLESSAAPPRVEFSAFSQEAQSLLRTSSSPLHHCLTLPQPAEGVPEIPGRSGSGSTGSGNPGGPAVLGSGSSGSSGRSFEVGR